ncbi:MAG: hypothetical protein IOC64_06690 [Methylobacterium sp.]|nr:hypothetical protein [Methylobacterium sp.]
MPLADFQAYENVLRRRAAGDFQQSLASGSATRLTDLAITFLPAPAVPTASVALGRNSDRAINGLNPTAGAGRMAILGGRLSPSGAGGVALILVDVLNISGGLNGTLTTAQTTGLPTAALTRYTSGEGVLAALIIHTSIGTTTATVTCSYTNQAGVSGRVTPGFVIDGTSRQAGCLRAFPLQAGDTGIRSVESVTLAGTTGTAGNFGVVMFKPIAMMFANDVEGASAIDCVSSGRMVGQFASYENDACLSCYATMPVNQVVSGAILVGEV